VKPTEYSKLLHRHYLAEFVPAGGSTVKFIVGSPEATRLFWTDLSSLSQRFLLGSAVASNTTALHPLHNAFFQIAKRLDWRALAMAFLRDILLASEWTLESRTDLSIENLAKWNGLIPVQVEDRVEKLLSKFLYAKPGLTPEFRHCFSALVWGVLLPEDYSRNFASDIAQSWLAGDIRAIHQCKPLHIYRRITANNARGILMSMCRIAKDAGFDGTVLLFDFSNYFGVLPNGRRYRPTQVMDLYETMRQFIDAVDSLDSTLLCFAGTEDFVGESPLSFRSYEALRLRLTNETFALDYPNVLAPLVELNA
jgi:hypothetical protein